MKKQLGCMLLTLTMLLGFSTQAFASVGYEWEEVCTTNGPMAGGIDTVEDKVFSFDFLMNRLHFYDFETDEWTMSSQRASDHKGGGFIAQGGQIYGVRLMSDETLSISIYEVATDSWQYHDTGIPYLPYAAFTINYGFVGQYYYIVAVDHDYLNTIILFDMETEEIKTVDKVIKRWHNTIGAYDGKLYFVGDPIGNGYNNKLYTYDVIEDMWEEEDMKIRSYSNSRYYMVNNLFCTDSYGLVYNCDTSTWVFNWEIMSIANPTTYFEAAENYYVQENMGDLYILEGSSLELIEWPTEEGDNGVFVLGDDVYLKNYNDGAIIFYKLIFD